MAFSFVLSTPLCVYSMGVDHKWSKRLAKHCAQQKQSMEFLWPSLSGPPLVK